VLSFPKPDRSLAVHPQTVRIFDQLVKNATVRNEKSPQSRRHEKPLEFPRAFAENLIKYNRYGHYDYIPKEFLASVNYNFYNINQYLNHKNSMLQSASCLYLLNFRAANKVMLKLPRLAKRKTPLLSRCI